MTTGEVVPGSTAIAVPILGTDASIATVYFAGAELDPDVVADDLATTARTIAYRDRTAASRSGVVKKPRQHG